MQKRNSPIIFLGGFFFLAVWGAASSLFGAGFGDCLWGGRNEATYYTTPYTPGMGNVTLPVANAPGMNLGAPDPAIPVQGTASTQPINVQQANVPTIPTIQVPTGPVGSVGQPATGRAATVLPNLPPGTELMYVMPPTDIPPEQCSPKGNPAVATQVVDPTTPGAIPVAVRNMVVTRPKVERRWTYGTIKETTETLVKVVDPRTGKVVRTYCETDERESTLPWPHLKEEITYEQVTVAVATPLSPTALRSLTPLQSGPQQPQPAAQAGFVTPTVQAVNRPVYLDMFPDRGNAVRTLVE